MTNYLNARNLKCKECGTPFSSAEGFQCECHLVNHKDGTAFCKECGEDYKGDKPFEACYQHYDVDELREEVKRLMGDLAAKRTEVMNLEGKCRELESRAKYKEAELFELRVGLLSLLERSGEKA